MKKVKHKSKPKSTKKDQTEESEENYGNSYIANVHVHIHQEGKPPVPPYV